MGRASGGDRSGIVLAIVLVSVMLAPSGLSANLELLNAADAACVSTGPGLPFIRVDPDCRPANSSSNSAAPQDVDATVENASNVTVIWTAPSAPIGPVTELRVYRGATPYTMQAVATLAADTSTFVDDVAFIEGDAVWYAVAAIYDGEIVSSEPTLIGPH